MHVLIMMSFFFSIKRKYLNLSVNCTIENEKEAYPEYAYVLFWVLQEKIMYLL